MRNNLYLWQRECLRQWAVHNGRGIVEAVTGAGKTRLALEACRMLEKKTKGHLRVKIIVPTAALMRQWSRALREHPNLSVNTEEIGLSGGGVRTPEERKYMIYIVNSARYTLSREILQDFKDGEKVLLIADECHHYVSGENSLIFEFRDHMADYEEQYFALGLSATLPEGEAGNFFAKVIGGRIYRYGLQKALQAETVCRYDIYHVEVPLSEDENAEYGELTEQMWFLYCKLMKLRPDLKWKSTGEIFEELRKWAGNKKRVGAKEAASYMQLSYKRKTLICTASARLECAVLLIRLLGTSQKMIIFGERISQAEELYRRLNAEFPGKTGRYHSKMGERANRNTLERFKNGEISILITCRSLDEGIDIPDAATGIVLSGTAALRQRTQRLGRIIRRAEGKERASLYYFYAAETSEDSYFLSEGKENRIYELEYIPETDEFYSKAYDRAAEAVWRKLAAEEQTEETRQEIFRCLELGSVRSDWRESREFLTMKRSGAFKTAEKNYWFCMEKVKEASEALTGRDESKDLNPLLLAEEKRPEKTKSAPQRGCGAYRGRDERTENHKSSRDGTSSPERDTSLSSPIVVFPVHPY